MEGGPAEARFGGSSAVRYDVGEDVQAPASRPMRRMGAVLAGVGALMAVACVGALVGFDASAGGSVALFAETGEVHRAEVQLQAAGTKLTKAVTESDRIKAQEQKLAGVASELKHEETAVRSEMHEARNAMVALKYKIHNLNAESFSAGMFGGAAKKAAHSHLALKKSLENHAAETTSKTFQQHLAQALMSAKTAPAPAKPASSAQPNQVSAAASPLGISLMKHVGGGHAASTGQTKPEPAAAKPVAESAVGTQEQLVADPRVVTATAQPEVATQPRPAAQQPAQTQRAKQYVPTALDQRTAAAARLAQLARKQAYERSGSFWRTEQERAQEEAARAYAPMPVLPVLSPLGPEAAAP